MSVRIHCINKDSGNHMNPHEAISHLGWINESTNKTGENTRLEMYNWIKDENGVAYVIGSTGKKVYVTTAIAASGTKYVRTIADDRETNNLLSLPECR